MKLFSLEKSRLRGEIMVTFQNLKRTYGKDGHRIFSRACWNGIRDNGFRLKEGRFRSDTGQKLFAVKVMIKH